MSKEKILVVDDEEQVRKVIIKSLLRENFITYSARYGKEALELINNNSFDLIILDIMMDDMDGLEIIRIIRNKGINIPILILSGRVEDHDKILGFGIGADDYITKPFSPAVLCAHVKAHIRRNKELIEMKEKSIRLKAGPFTLNLNTYKLYKNNHEIMLSAKETMLLKFFMENPNQVFSKEQLYQNIWGDSIIDDNSIMVYIRHLRTKIEDNPKNPEFIQTVWGIGYKFVI
ncbi:MAG: response regulator transcription factor [Clostridia bacterium]|nr:response regulator transcription factor [Clostridia bacterium]